MSDKITIEFTAAITQLQTGIAQATQAVHNSGQQISSSSQHVTNSINNMHAQIGNAMTASVSKISSGYSAIQGAFAKVQSAALGIGAVLAGGAMFAGAISNAMEFAAENRRLAVTLGISAEAATTLNIALKEIGMTSDDYIGMSTKMVRQLKTKEGAFQALGVQIRDTNGNYLSQDQVMQNAIDTLRQFKEGTDRNVVAQFLFGRGAGELDKMLKLTREQMEHAHKMYVQLGLSTVEGIEPMKKYKEAMADTKLMFTAAAGEIMRALLPKLTDLAHYIIANAEPACKLLNKALGGLQLAFLVVQGVVSVVITGLKQLVHAAAAAGMVLYDIFTGNWGDIKADAKKGLANIKDDYEYMMFDLKNIVQSGMDTVNDLIGGETKKPKAAKTSTGGTKTLSAAQLDALKDSGTSKEKKAPQEKSLLGEWRDELEKKKEVEANYFKDSRDMELTFWQGKLNLTKTGTKDRFSVEHEIYQLKKAMAVEAFQAEITTLKAQADAENKSGTERIKIAEKIVQRYAETYGKDSKEYAQACRDKEKIERQHQEEMAKLDTIRTEHQAKIKLLSQEMELDRIKYLEQLGAISAQEQIEQTRQVEQQKHQIMLDAAKAAAAISGLKPEEKLKRDLEIENLEGQHQKRMTELNQQSSLENIATWKSFYQSITSAVNQSVQGMIQGTLTLRDGIRKIGQSIVLEMVNRVIKKIVDEWIWGEIMKLSISKTYAGILTALGITTAAIQTSTQAGASATTVGIKGAEATTVVTANTVEGATGVLASLSSIPYIGWALGLAAFAAVMALGMGALSSISAAGGYDIPAGINPVVQTHANEMILPANLADRVRNMTAQPGSGSGTLTLSAKGIRPNDLYKGSQFVKMVQQLNRDYHLTPKMVRV